ncbi:MAG: AbrB/MazE/SpoVT family DNA-binding domain-containing protein [Candidatus Eremiobacteraeota bacterium]|nr:AbrB/MazE/SpoVT family DNA-binding domain-containing protein [Candidatus Eremiobacteraeota bacterium]
MRVRLRQMGNSQGIILPKAFLAQIGLTRPYITLTFESDAIVLRKSKKVAREGWADAAQRLSAAKDDACAWGEFSNDEKADPEL